MAEYAFDCSAFITVRLTAASEAEARAALEEVLRSDVLDGIQHNPEGGPCAVITVGADDSEPDLVEVDGEAV